ncbi:type VII secretion-associated serine protease mycosin, partial [Kitasatospora putterlickiae]|uniref:type VII secretion-associated serine protease mycosin n=1 Tax=Kitasatospora putterlickiae TaxID=221725 RepID=UPI0031CFE96C
TPGGRAVLRGALAWPDGESDEGAVMRRTIGRVRGRGFAATLLAAGIVVGPAVGPAAAVDSIRDQQWHLDAMKAAEIWKVSRGQGVTVAVIDGGFRLDHPDLAGQFLPGKDFSGLPGGLGDDKSGHGTKMSGLVAGTGKGIGGQGAYGLAPGVKLLPLKIKNDENVGGVVNASEFFTQVSQAITYAADQGAKVISISQGSAASNATPMAVTALTDAVTHARSKGSLVVASVGNSAQKGNPVEYPGAIPTVLGVGAVDQNGTVTAESERGPQVDLAAPGVEIYSSCSASSGYCKGHGTSDATALVSASAALVWAVHPDWTGNQVARVLLNTAGKADDGAQRNDAIGYGIVRPRVALTEPGDPGPADAYPIQEQPVGQPAPTAPAVPSATPLVTASASAAPVPGEAGTSALGREPVGEEGSGAGSVVPVVVGVAAGVVVLVVAVIVVVTRRRAARPQQAAPGAVPPPPAYGPPAPPSDNPYAR